MIKNNGTTPEIKELEEILVDERVENRLILHNDDFNTFDFVIECLMAICKHTRVQAEQCSLIIHHKGKCEVKSGDLETLIPMHQALLGKGLSSEII